MDGKPLVSLFPECPVVPVDPSPLGLTPRRARRASRRLTTLAKNREASTCGSAYTHAWLDREVGVAQQSALLWRCTACPSCPASSSIPAYIHNRPSPALPASLRKIPPNLQICSVYAAPAKSTRSNVGFRRDGRSTPPLIAHGATSGSRAPSKSPSRRTSTTSPSCRSAMDTRRTAMTSRRWSAPSMTGNSSFCCRGVPILFVSTPTAPSVV